MSVTKIASRYAKSLLDLAREQGVLEEVLSDIKAFQKVTDNRDFYLMLKSPIVKADKKQAVISTLFAGKVNNLTLEFLKILVRKGREIYLPEIDDQFIEQYKKLKHITTVKITSASPLSDQQLKVIQSKLKSSSITDENLDIETEVNEDLIGGFVIEIGDKLYDASVIHKLETMKNDFTTNNYVNTIS